MLPRPARRLATSVTACLLFVPLAAAEAPAHLGSVTKAHAAGQNTRLSSSVLTMPAEPVDSGAVNPHRHRIQTSRGAVRTRPVAHLQRRTHPGHVTVGHYLRTLDGTRRDIVRMRALGARDARRNPGGIEHHVLLDIGGQVPGGVYLSGGNHFVSYSGLVRAVVAYVRGYFSHQRANAPATVSIGTNNDLDVSYAAGRKWARSVVNPVRAKTVDCTTVTVAGANDIEPGFRGGPTASRAWLRGFLRNTTAPFVFNGSADGCSPDHPMSGCDRGWTMRDLAALAGAYAPSRILALPQIYNPDMAGQWAQISRTAARLNHRPLRIIGPLTETAACGHDATCPTMPSALAWRLLWRALHKAHLHPTSLPGQVDLDVR